MMSSLLGAQHHLQCPCTRTRTFNPPARFGCQRLAASSLQGRRRQSLRAVPEPATEAAPAEAEQAATAPPQPQTPPALRSPGFLASFLWLEGSIGVCVDQIFSQGQRSPVTEYFLWPRRDAWDELKASLDGKTWISEADKNDLLNTTTAVFEYWQEEPKHSLQDARSKFPESIFIGS